MTAPDYRTLAEVLYHTPYATGGDGGWSLEDELGHEDPQVNARVLELALRAVLPAWLAERAGGLDAAAEAALAEAERYGSHHWDVDDFRAALAPHFAARPDALGELRRQCEDEIPLDGVAELAKVETLRTVIGWIDALSARAPEPEPSGEAGQSPTPGAAGCPSALAGRSTDDLLGWAVAHVKNHRDAPAPRWALVKVLLGLGSTSATQVCRHYGVDPDEDVPCGQAPASPTLAELVERLEGMSDEGVERLGDSDEEEACRVYDYYRDMGERAPKHEMYRAGYRAVLAELGRAHTHTEGE